MQLFKFWRKQNILGLLISKLVSSVVICIYNYLYVYILYLRLKKREFGKGTANPGLKILFIYSLNIFAIDI